MAAVDDLIAKNPCRAASVSRPTTSTRRIVPWPTEWVSALHDALPAEYRIAVTLASGLGLRQGEVFGLAVEDVNFLRGTVEVRRQVKVFNGHKLAFGLPKGQKTRTVALPESIASELSSHLVWILLFLGGGVVLPLSRMPDQAAAVLKFLPSAALADGLSEVFQTGAVLPAQPILILLGWSVVGFAAAARWLRWE
jgi:integrase